MSGRGLAALLGMEDDDTVVTLVFCPACAEREFGGQGTDVE